MSRGKKVLVFKARFRLILSLFNFNPRKFKVLIKKPKTTESWKILEKRERERETEREREKDRKSERKKDMRTDRNIENYREGEIDTERKKEGE